MFRSKNILWITFAFCVTTGSCEDVYQQSGTDVKMDCPSAKPNAEIEWKLNNVLVLGISTTGRERKGSLHVSQRARIEKTSLKITAVKSEDSGVYTCSTTTHKLYVVSAHANPSSVLYSTGTNLNCDVTKDFKGTICWTAPDSKSYSQSMTVVESVTSDNAGLWTCHITDVNGEEVFKLNVKITVVGPLNTTEEVTTYEGGIAELPCFLPAPSTLPITGGSWTSETASHISFPALMRTNSDVKWNSTGVSTDKVTVRDEQLNKYFNVTLKRVNADDAGVYVCSLVFEGGKSLSAKLKLTVLKTTPTPDNGSGDSNVTWYTPVSGVPLWVWVAVAVSTVFLVVIIILIYCRNKRMKRKMKKLKSKQLSLKSRVYCTCGRADNSRVQGKESTRTGKRERPPSLPRHQYSYLNE
ncbi:CD4-2 molecule, tandem duplicate 2 [Pangasianodon hypophthalmus]|uniref:CD4-2 molecule, tandem duplicate 2 n=1 Tax=Pangasianodon hypophthalmus TaxID=310915 RepID=UPI002307B778|nr:CD4-2 molecule, tandem duplicate 2 [Pangasianodon hypophthalmus]